MLTCVHFSILLSSENDVTFLLFLHSSLESKNGKWNKWGRFSLWNKLAKAKLYTNMIRSWCEVPVCHRTCASLVLHADSCLLFTSNVLHYRGQRHIELRRKAYNGRNRSSSSSQDEESHFCDSSSQNCGSNTDDCADQSHFGVLGNPQCSVFYDFVCPGVK